MKIFYSRHAKRRMNLYHITEASIEKMLKDKKKEGRQEIIGKLSGYTYPIKVVFDIQGDLITIITAYPLKRGMQ